MKKLRGAVIGYGFIASRGHLPAYLERQKTHDDVAIVAVADPCEARRRTAAECLPEARLYTDAATLIEREAANLDFIDIATPPAFHAPIAAAALEHGLHVLCEKPLTTTADEARRLLDKAASNQRVLFPCHNYKHAPVIKAIRSVLDTGRIGKVTAITLSTFRNTHAKGVAEWRPNWRRDRSLSGGGIAMDHGSHSFYLCFDWLGEYPTAITAKTTCVAPQFHDTEDNFSAVLAFPSGLANVQLSWTSGVRKVIYAIQGERGAITVDDDELQLAVQRPSEAPDAPPGSIEWSVDRRAIVSHWMDASHANWFNSLFDQFCVAIDADEFVGRDAREAALCVQLIEAGYRSAQQGCREVAVEAVW
jgi:predicted dehydrogenase